MFGFFLVVVLSKMSKRIKLFEAQTLKLKEALTKSAAFGDAVSEWITHEVGPCP
jgi:hypothetical protein